MTSVRASQFEFFELTSGRAQKPVVILLQLNAAIKNGHSEKISEWPFFLTPFNSMTYHKVLIPLKGVFFSMPLDGTELSAVKRH